MQIAGIGTREWEVTKGSYPSIAFTKTRSKQRAEDHKRKRTTFGTWENQTSRTRGRFGQMFWTKLSGESPLLSLSFCMISCILLLLFILSYTLVFLKYDHQQSIFSQIIIPMYYLECNFIIFLWITLEQGYPLFWIHFCSTKPYSYPVVGVRKIGWFCSCLKQTLLLFSRRLAPAANAWV